jgi:hypothetical protein
MLRLMEVTKVNEMCRPSHLGGHSGRQAGINLLTSCQSGKAPPHAGLAVVFDAPGVGQKVNDHRPETRRGIQRVCWSPLGMDYGAPR